jgi:hypothetical protein
VKTRRRKPKRNKRKIVARKVVSDLLRNRITPRPPPKPKVTPQFRARFLAYVASHDLRLFDGVIRMAAKTDDKLFFNYLDKYLKNKPIRLPISENERRLLAVIFQNPRISAKKALEQLGWKMSTSDYGVLKLRALRRSKLMTRVWREGYLADM